MVDIARDARWGRGVEGAGEDVYLGRQFAAARVRGFQGPDLSRADAMLATPKHFAGYGAAEGGLDYNTVDLSERTLREVYLPPFRAAIDAGALSIMSAFNEIGGIPSNANRGAADRRAAQANGASRASSSPTTPADEELIAHGFAADGREAARRAFMAGTDVSMQSGLYMKYLPEPGRSRRGAASRGSTKRCAACCGSRPSSACSTSRSAAWTKPDGPALRRGRASGAGARSGEPLHRAAQERRRSAAAAASRARRSR